MNMISQLRQRIARTGTATITTEEFNQLQAEWITRTKMEKDELTASPVEHGVMPYAQYSNEQLQFIANSGSILLCAYLKEHSKFDAESIKRHLAIANVAAAEELKRRAKA